MFFQAEQQFNIDLLTSYFVGDNITDALAAQNAGCKFSFVETGMCTRKDIIPYDPDFVGPNLLEVAKHTIKESQE